MLVDVENGRALELEALVGSVLELARITGTPVPTIEALYAVVRLLEATLQGQASMLRLQPRSL
jgi:2-dehydropantoate 2-reductase